MKTFDPSLSPLADAIDQSWSNPDSVVHLVNTHGYAIHPDIIKKQMRQVGTGRALLNVLAVHKR